MIKFSYLYDRKQIIKVLKELIMSCYTEQEIAIEAIKVIKKHPGIRTSELIKQLETIMKPDGEDMDILDNRNDTKFSQKVRNLTSHDSLADSVYTVGERNRQWFPLK